MNLRSLAALCCVVSATCTLKAHALFSDHVVLQTIDDGGAGARISGTGKAGEEITLKVGTSAAGKAKVDASGGWSLSVNMTSGGPHTLTLSGSESHEELTASDVLFGDVYICSGQVRHSY